MRYTQAVDPSYNLKLIEWDLTEELLSGRRPSNAVNSTHLWYGLLNLDLPVGEHKIEVGGNRQIGKNIQGCENIHDFRIMSRLYAWSAFLLIYQGFIE